MLISFTYSYMYAMAVLCNAQHYVDDLWPIESWIVVLEYILNNVLAVLDVLLE